MGQGQHASENQFRRVIEAAPDGIVISRDGIVLFANPAAVRLLGHDDASELVGRPMSSFLEPQAVAMMRERMIAIAREGRALPPQEYVARTRDGSRVTAEITSLPIEWEGAPAFIALARDVTERAQRRASLERADRLSALGTLAAGVAHEVNNPLAYVSLGLDTLEHMVNVSMAPDAKAAALEVLADIRGGTARVSKIVRGLRSFALDQGDGEVGATTSLGEVFDATEQLVAHEVRHHARLTFEKPRSLHVPGSAHRLEQVLVNLVLNASQGSGGEARPSQIFVRAVTVSETRVSIEVSDDGPGISPTIVGRIFDPFFTTKPVNVGSGLGLAICHRIVTELGGEIGVESELGRGATFRVTLPLVAAPTKLEPEIAGPIAAPKRLRVLIADDELGIGRLLQKLMKHEVEVVTSGAEALHLLLSERTFDVVLCDLMMPDVSGIEVYERVAAARPGLERKFVFITGGAFSAHAAAFLARVASPHVLKPFGIPDLERAMKQVTGD